MSAQPGNKTLNGILAGRIVKGVLMKGAKHAMQSSIGASAGLAAGALSGLSVTSFKPMAVPSNFSRGVSQGEKLRQSTLLLCALLEFSGTSASLGQHFCRYHRWRASIMGLLPFPQMLLLLAVQADTCTKISRSSCLECPQYLQELALHSNF